MTENKLENILRDLSPQELEFVIASGIDIAADREKTDRLLQAVMKRAKQERIITMNKKTTKRKALSIVAAVLIFTLTATGVFAAVKRFVLPAEDLQEELGFIPEQLQVVADPENAQPGDILLQDKQVVVDGYTVTFEALVKAKALREIVLGDTAADASAGSTYGDGLFAVVTVSRDDGGIVYAPEGDEKTLNPSAIGASPLIHGVVPNMSTYQSIVVNQFYDEEANLLYLFVDLSDVACFADQKMSLAVYGSFVFDSKWFELDKTGAPQFTQSKDMPALQALFELPLDPDYADSAAQQEFMQQRPFQWAN